MSRAALPRSEAVLAAIGPALLLAGALVPAGRPFVAVLVVLGWPALRLLHRPSAIAWAAVLPLSVVLVWPWLLGADAPIGDPACRDPFSVIAVRRLAVAGVGLALVGALAVAHASSWTEIGLRRATVPEAFVSVAGCLILIAAGLFVGPAIARPFFGELEFPVPPEALVPAILFGVANGVLEEVLYRGALQAWLGRRVPLAWISIAG